MVQIHSGIGGKKRKTLIIVPRVCSSSMFRASWCVFCSVSFIWLHAYAFAIHSMDLVHYRSTFEPGASGLPYYCTSICVRSWCNWRSLWIPNQTKKKNPYWVTERVPGLPLETRPFVTVLCQGVSRWAQSMWQTENFFMRFYLVLGLAPICVLCHHTLGAHIPTVQFATFSDFCVNFFSSAPSIFFVITIHQVIWRSPGTLVSESSLEWSIDRLSSPRSRHSLDISQRPDH